MLFERLQNAAIWSRLDIMQDLQVRDVDKRLSRFLADLHEGYRNVYVNLSCRDLQDRVVSSSDAAAIGTTVNPQSPWLTTTLSGSRLNLRLDGSRSRTDVAIDVDIPSAFGNGPLGTLSLNLDWSEFDGVLDQASREGGRMLVILDRGGRVIAGSKAIRDRGLVLSDVLSGWRSFPAAVATHEDTPLSRSPVVVATAAAPGYAPFGGFGWTTFVVQPLTSAFEPIRRMAIIFVALLGGIVAFTLLIALWISHTLARPIVALTRVARVYMQDKVLQAPASSGSGEIGELTEAFVRMVRDIDSSQQKLVRASKLAAVGEMSSIIAHEVRTPLGILRSSAQMLHREPGISEESRELVAFIESETERLNRLVSVMLDTARPRAPAYGRTDLHVLIPRTVAMLGAQAVAKRIDVGVALGAADPCVDCDEEQITQVVLNILMNGLQILHLGGRMQVATHDDDAGVTIEVADDGPGIDPAERTRIFEAFFFRREGGIGLGLAVVQQIVLSHGGDIEASDSPLGGALFRVRLPRQPESKS